MRSITFLEQTMFEDDETDINACMIMHQSGDREMANEAFEKTAKFDRFLTDNLRMWKDSGIPAPKNEIQSIHAWMGMLREQGQEETLKRMAARLVLLDRAARQLNALGPETEDEAGIYDERPEARPE